MENHILFYSNYCSNCKEFVSLLYKSPFFENFKKICVDNNPKIPKEITSIPCIIVPKILKPLVGSEAFHWLRGMNQMYLKEQENKVNDNASQQAHYSNNTPKAEGQQADPTNLSYAMGSVTAYSGTMGGFSDNFSFIGNEAPMEHSFSFLGDNSHKINTPQEGQDPRDSMESSSGKKNDMDKDFERLIAMRNKETPQPVMRQ